MKIATIVGARPQFIKASAVSRALRALPEVREVLIHTGQHYDDNMSAVFFRELDVPDPQYHLGIGSGRHGAQTGQMLEAIERVLINEAPDGVLVYGDTNSTLAGALAAAKLRIPLAHVEAGLRSFNRAMPEETNRVLADHVSDLLFAPTAAAVRNLAREGITGDQVLLVGDVMYDAALYFAAKAQASSRALETLGLEPGRYVLATLHRAENTDDRARLSAIFASLNAIAADVTVVLPLHPRTRKALDAMSGERRATGVRMVTPLGYLDMTMLERHARLIITDSGGVQKEAFFHGVACITLRTETEWVELVECGWNRVVPPLAKETIVGALQEALARHAMPPRPQLYGEGTAATEIAGHMFRRWASGRPRG